MICDFTLYCLVHKDYSVVIFSRTVEDFELSDIVGMTIRPKRKIRYNVKFMDHWIVLTSKSYFANITFGTLSTLNRMFYSGNDFRRRFCTFLTSSTVYQSGSIKVKIPYHSLRQSIEHCSFYNCRACINFFIFFFPSTEAILSLISFVYQKCLL